MSKRAKRALAAAARLVALWIAIATLLLWAGSLRYSATVTGHPYNHDTSIRGGALVAQWFTLEPDGSIAGFGNPGWGLSPRPTWRVYLLPKFDMSTTHHFAVIPLWPLPVLFAFSAYLLARLVRRLRAPELCTACAYPRSGLPAEAPCPECGRRGILRRLLAWWRGRPQQLVPVEVA